jgi:dolichol-phosphate mannosyltransferase
VAADISIIVPVFNEAENILPLAKEVAAALAGERRSVELVFVDDASTDDTWAKIEEAHRLDPRVRGLRHSRNGGQSAALWTGLQNSSGAVLATLDGDLQNDPADLPKLIGELARVDFVSGMRLARRDNFVRRASSQIARWVRQRVLKSDFRDTGCAIRAFKRSALEGLFPFNGLHRFLPLLVHGNGVITLEVPVKHRPRLAGVSKYGVWNRLGRGIYDLFAIAWYQKRRLRPVPFTELKESANPTCETRSPKLQDEIRNTKEAPNAERGNDARSVESEG